MTNWVNQHRLEGPIDYVFEEGAVGRGEVDEVLREIDREQQKKSSMRLGKWWFANKRQQISEGVVVPAVLPLQAADFLAYETYKQMANRIVDGVKRNVRKSLWDLLRVSHYSNYFDKGNLAELVALIDADKEPT